MVTLNPRPLPAVEEAKDTDQAGSFPFRSHLLTLDAGVRTHIQAGPRGNYELRPGAHEQLAERLGIPHSYYLFLKEALPSLLECNVNELLRLRPRAEVCTVRLDRAGYVCGLSFDLPHGAE